MKREAGFAGFLGETFALLSDAGRSVLIFVLALGGLNAAGVLMGLAKPSQDLGSFGGGFMYTPETGIGGAIFDILSGIAIMVASYFLLVKYLEARRLLRERQTRIWAYVGLTFLSVLGIIGGMILLIIPGLILLVRWSAATGYLIGAHEGIVDSLKASWHATSGYGWAIFFAGLVMLIILAIAGGIVGGTAGVTGSRTAIDIVVSFANAFGNAISLAFGVGVYHLLYNDDHALGEVFA